MTAPTHPSSPPCRSGRPVLLAAALVVVASLFMAACQPDDADSLLGQSAHELPPEHDAFWSSLLELCGMAFEGTDDEVRRVMHVRHCSPDQIQIPLHVDDDRSRTWILTRQPEGLRLKHDHRHEDGTEEEVTQYGGDTRDAGSPESQDFYADDFTAELVPGAGNNIWTMELVPGETFSYQLVRTGEDWQVRWDFDLTSPVEPPPAPWGYEDTDPTH